MKHLILIIAIVSLCAAADEPTKSPATLIYEKALADNSKEAEKQYDAYTKALEVANGKIIKVLESAKADLNDPKKGKLTITERAKAIEELDGKIKEVKGGALGEKISSHKDDNLLGEQDIQRDIIKQLTGKWTLDLANNNHNTVEIDKNSIITLNGNSGFKTKIIFVNDSEMSIPWNEKQTWFIHLKDKQFIMGVNSDFAKLVRVSK